jgi:hypothetical protein
MSSTDSDSGSPVLFRSATGEYFLVGILWGGQSLQYSNISYWRWIRFDLTGWTGNLNPLGSNLTVSISGPQYILYDDYYTWQAHVSGGDGSYAYIWERRTKTGDTFGPWSGIGYDQPSHTELMCGKGGPYTSELRVTVSSAGRTRVSPSYPYIENYSFGNHECPL